MTPTTLRPAAPTATKPRHYLRNLAKGDARPACGLPGRCLGSARTVDVTCGACKRTMWYRGAVQK